MNRRLIVSYLAVTVVVLLLLEVPLAVFYGRRELERLTAAVERDAAVIATVYEDDLEAGFAPDAGPARRYAERVGARVVVVDRQGISVVDTEQATPRDFSTRPEIATALAGRRAAGTRASETLGTDLLYVALPVASSGIVHGALRLTLDTSEVDARIHRFWWGLVAIGAVVLAAMSLVGWLIARSVTLPLLRLNEQARRYGRGELDIDPPSTGGPPEIRELGETLGAMGRDLAAMIDEQRAFVADASHQLRTPLTGLRLGLENLQAELDAAGAARVDVAIDEIERLSTLVGDLLQLARADRQRGVVPQDLARLTAERVDTWGAVAETASVGLVLDCDPSAVMVSAVPGAIEQILDNVLDNAIGHSPPGSEVHVSVRVGDGSAVLEIGDRGPGLSDEDKRRALRRFWRGDTTRSGSGLGLAIVDSLARASGGRVQLRDRAGGGLSVVVELLR